MKNFIPICVAYGDGIGPEIMEAVIHILKEAEVPLSIETIEVGEKIYKRNYSSGIAPDTWDTIARTQALLKSPITTPQGGGYKSLNVTMRKTLGLYANIRPCVAYAPYVKTSFPKLDLVIVRENEEDIYSGIEYRQTHSTYESMKLISKVGCEKIIRYAFEFAVKNNRKKVTCMSKDNIMKFTDGIFHKTFDLIAKEYPGINTEHYIIDIGSARLATKPEIFEVIVTSNLYGDIISDIVAEISGSVGLAGSANIGKNYAMFEAIHGSAPDIAGHNIANPSGLLNASVMMLIHLGLGEYASLIENAWKKTLEEGMHTADIYREDLSAKKLGTKEFALEIIKRLGEQPAKLKAVNYENENLKQKQEFNFAITQEEEKKLVGVDVYFDWTQAPSELASIIENVKFPELKLQMLAAKGLKVWPVQSEINLTSDHFRARFFHKDEKPISHLDIIKLLEALQTTDLDFIKVENLYKFDDQIGYSLSQGE